MSSTLPLSTRLFSPKNWRKLLEETNAYLDEKNVSEKVRQVIFSELHKHFPKGKQESKTWKSDFDYDLTAKKIIFNITWDEVASGNYHLYYGVLNPMRIGPELQSLCVSCLYEFAEKGYISESERDEQISLLQYKISIVG